MQCTCACICEFDWLNWESKRDMYRTLNNQKRKCLCLDRVCSQEASNALWWCLGQTASFHFLSSVNSNTNGDKHACPFSSVHPPLLCVMRKHILHNACDPGWVLVVQCYRLFKDNAQEPEYDSQVCLGHLAKIKRSVIKCFRKEENKAVKTIVRSSHKREQAPCNKSKRYRRDSCERLKVTVRLIYSWWRSGCGLFRK